MKFLNLICCLLFVACNQKTNKVVQIDKSIMKLHDEAMAKSGYVLALKKQINNRLDSTIEGTFKDSLQVISAKLFTADRMMLDWMHQYKTPNYETDTAENYLNIQLDKMYKVHTITFESINLAETILKNEK